MDAAQLGHVIRTRRRELRITQRELAELAGVGTRLVYEIEKGAGNPGLDALIAVARALGLELCVGPPR